MSVRINVKNFQSIGEAEVIVDRFTVVTGQNNSGKSALMRAVQGVFTNAPGESYVKHGADRFSVRLSFDDGHVVEWEKGSKIKPTYTIDGKKINPGRGIPDEVAALGVRSVDVGQTTTWPQIAPQFTGQVYLLDLPGSSVAEAVADVDRIRCLTQALRLADSDKRSAQSDYRSRKKEVDSLQRDLEHFNGVDLVAHDVEIVEHRVRDIMQLEHELSELKSIQQRMNLAQSQIQRLSGLREIRIPEPQQFVTAQKISTELTRLTQVAFEYRRTQTQISFLGRVRSVTVPERPTMVDKTRQELEQAQRLQTVRSKALHQLQRLQAAQIRDRQLENTNMQALVAKAAHVQRALQQINTWKATIQQQRSNILLLKADIQSKTHDIHSLDSDVQQVLTEIGVCPICATPILDSPKYRSVNV